MLTVRSTIEIASQASPQIIPVVQGDTGREILFTLADFTIPTGATATFYIQKPSGNAVYNTATIDGNTVLVELTAQSIIEIGDNYGQVRISKNSEVVTSFDFILLVKPFRGIEATESTTEMNIFDQAVAEAMEQIDSSLDDIVAEDYDSTSTYDKGEYCLYDGKLYICSTAITTAEAWNSSHWTAVTVGEALTDLKQEISQMSGLSSDIKDALLQIASKCAYIDDDGQDYYDALEAALYPPAELESISAVYTQSGTVYPSTSLDDLKTDLVVTAHYDDSSSETVTSYTLSGTLTEGTSTVTVSYGGKTTTFEVTVSASPYTFYDYAAMTYNAGETVPANYGIVTDIPMSSDWIMELSFKYPSQSLNTAQNILGIRNGQYGTKEFGFFVTPSTSKLGYWYANTDTTQNITALVADQLNTIVVQPVGVSSSFPNNATIKLNNTDYSTGSTATGQTWNSWLSLFEYGTSATTTSDRTDLKSIGLQLGEIVIKTTSNTVLYDLKPAKYQSNYGFYDSVNDKFYYNSTYADKYTCGNWS